MFLSIGAVGVFSVSMKYAGYIAASGYLLNSHEFTYNGAQCPGHAGVWWVVATSEPVHSAGVWTKPSVAPLIIYLRNEAL